MLSSFGLTAPHLHRVVPSLAPPPCLSAKDVITQGLGAHHPRVVAIVNDGSFYWDHDLEGIVEREDR